MTQASCLWRQWTFADKTAPESLALAAEILKDRIEHGFTYTSETCRFCAFEPATQPGCFGALMGKDGTAATLKECNQDGALVPVDLSVVFQLCLFGKDVELRWERMDGTKGWVTLSTDDTRVALSADKLAKLGGHLVGDRQVRCRDHVYLLWGKRSDDATPPGWTRLTSARIGALWAPWSHETERAENAERIVLTAREYFESGAMGNVAFIGERLTGFRAACDDDAKLAGA